MQCRGFLLVLAVAAMRRAAVVAGSTDAEAAAAEHSSSAVPCGLSYSQAAALARRTWDDLLLILADRVELLAFEDSVLQYVKHPSLRRTLRPLHLVEGTEVSGLRAGDITLLDVNDTEPAVYFNVKLKPLKIRGALRVGDNSHLIRALLVDTEFRFRAVVDYGDMPAPGLLAGRRGRGVAATRYGLARAGHVTHLQVANGDRTETGFGQELEALLAGAAVTTVWFELQRAASVHANWERERPRPLQWEPTQAPQSWGVSGI
ncbi:hypothetical protein ONE63_001331 [Megalurothrips usitatus]|uniref:Uncharacterized protein n=1 Tax=Megalurothrips usitatus TaxID=439358 RepID=A0AAV7XFI5_9NEOP|nr:hypothetical protein ONE63_001331 [Megalurothrips usitatus]